MLFSSACSLSMCYRNVPRHPPVSSSNVTQPRLGLGLCVNHGLCWVSLPLSPKWERGNWLRKVLGQRIKGTLLSSTPEEECELREQSLKSWVFTSSCLVANLDSRYGSQLMSVDVKNKTIHFLIFLKVTWCQFRVHTSWLTGGRWAVSVITFLLLGAPR